MQYYLFIDESGDPDFRNIDPNFPCFAVCGVLVSMYNYQDMELRLKALKHKYWGEQRVILRSYNIRKNRHEFEIFKDNKELKQDFISSVNKLVSDSRFKVICPVIHKPDLKEKYGTNTNDAYATAIAFLLQKSIYCLNRQPTSTPKKLKIILEKRGSNLDSNVLSHLNKLMESGCMYTPASEYSKYGKDISFESKHADLAGLQIADLMAYPIVTKIQYPDRENLAYNHVISKLDHKNGIVDGYGVIRFPRTKKPEINRAA